MLSQAVTPTPLREQIVLDSPTLQPPDIWAQMNSLMKTTKHATLFPIYSTQVPVKHERFVRFNISCDVTAKMSQTSCGFSAFCVRLQYFTLQYPYGERCIAKFRFYLSSLPACTCQQ